jgi:RimJ/RimL family protein N-acetyltransferase
MLSNPGLVTDKDCVEYLTLRGKGWVCEINNAVIAFAIADLIDNNIWALFVLPDFEGNGIGKAILQYLIDLAKKQKLHTMIAVIDYENQSSVAFHEQFGFTTVGIIKESGYKFERWLHSVIMQLMLK